jgi:hypothetical protein
VEFFSKIRVAEQFGLRNAALDGNPKTTKHEENFGFTPF